MNDSLKIWLVIATRDIGRLGKQRIETEIMQHFEEAYHAALEDGLSASNAETRALESLGDADEAKKQFRKLHLTQDDEAVWGLKIRRALRYHPAWSILRLAMACFMSYFMIWSGDLFQIMMSFMFFLWGAENIWEHRYLSKRMPQKAFIFGPLFTMGLSLVYLPLGFFMFRVEFMSLNPWMQTLLIVLCSSTLLLLPKGLRDARKLPKQLSEKEMAILQNTY